MSETLKPCPFCGSDDISEGPHSPYIICNGCGAFGPGNSDVTHEEAIAAWNTRTPEQVIAATPGSMSVTVDDALSLLDEMNEQGRIEYADYSQLHDAIAATLGGVGSEVGSEVTSEVRGGKLTAEQVRKAIERNVTFYEGGDYDAQEIADELNTMLGSGECTPHGEWKSISQTQEVRHVFCECGFELGMDRRDSFPFECTRLFAMPNFCPECGRKIRKAVKQ